MISIEDVTVAYGGFVLLDKILVTVHYLMLTTDS